MRATARHLAARHGAGHLLLASRSGPGAPGVAALCGELAAAGAAVAVTACDTASPPALAALLAGLERPLSAVIHAAGALDDAVLANLSPARLEAGVTPKADAAWLLHQHTAGQPLAAFICYSSAAATLGSPGTGRLARPTPTWTPSPPTAMPPASPPPPSPGACGSRDTGMTRPPAPGRPGAG